jgi:hypothetical protein
MITQTVRQLVRRIHLALEGELSQSELMQLAEEYAEICRQGNQRLDQLLTLIEKGSLYSALQLAEVEPPVMDLVAQLSFPASPQWREFCIEQKLPVPEKLNESAIRHVSELYHNKTLDTSYLYREYRSWILQKDRPQALQCLRAILRMNPSDQNARDEAQRLQELQMKEVLHEIEVAMATGDGKRILALMAEVESFPDVIPERSVVWSQALALRKELEKSQAHIRVEELKEEIIRLADAGHYERLLQRKKTWEQLLEHTHLQVSQDALDLVNHLAAQAKQELSSKVAEEEQSQIAAEWFKYLHQVEQELQKGIDSRACREKLQQIADFRSSLLSAGALPDQELESLSNRVTRRLQRKIQYQKQALYVVIGIAALLILTGVCVGGLFWNQNNRIKEAVASMTAALADRNIEQAQLLLRSWNYQGSDFLNTPEIAALAQQAEERIGREVLNESRVEQLYAQIRSAILTGPSQTERILDGLNEANALWTGLLPHSRERLDFTRRDVLQLWERERSNWLSQDRTTLQRMHQEVEEQWESRIQKGTPSPQMKKELVMLQEEVESAKTVLLRIEQLAGESVADQQYWADMEQRVGALSKQMDLFFAAENRLEHGDTLDEHREAVVALAQVAFPENPLVAAARAIVPYVDQWSDPGASLLRPGGLSPVRGQTSMLVGLRFYPERLSPVENLQLKELFEDSIALKLYRYDLDTYLRGVKQGGTARLLALGEIALRSNPPYGDREEVIQIVRLVTPVSVLQEPWYQEAEYRVTRLLGSGNFRDGSAIANGVRLPEGEFLEKFKKQLGYDSTSGQIGRPILYALDELFRGHHNLDPVFKAWVFAELVRMGMNRPEEWGLLAAPAVLKDWERLQLIYGGVPVFMDWLDPVRYEQLRSRADVFFKKQSVPSYMRQASFHNQLVNLLGRNQWGYWGYVGLSGVVFPVSKDADSSPESRYLWGMNRDKQWVSLYEKTDGAWKVLDVAMPLTPLFHFAGDLAEYTKEAGNQVGIKSESELRLLQEYLPKYFR